MNAKSSLSNWILYTCIISAICSTEVYASGWNDYDIKLVNGYRLVRTNASSIFIFPPDSVHHSVYDGYWAIPPKITGLNIFNDLVFGYKESPSNSDPGPQGPLGFFVLDTKNHKVELGLDERSWLESLRTHGIVEKPLLKKPSRNLETSGIYVPSQYDEQVEIIKKIPIRTLERKTIVPIWVYIVLLILLILYGFIFVIFKKNRK